MGAPLDIAALNERALMHRRDVLARLVYRDGRVSNEVRALNWQARRLPGLHVSLDELGRWSACTDEGLTQGRGVCQLVAALADVTIERAAAFVARLPELDRSAP
jgi:polyribonucleotide nucleotidyltransferase